MCCHVFVGGYILLTELTLESGETVGITIPKIIMKTKRPALKLILFVGYLSLANNYVFLACGLNAKKMGTV